MSSERLDLVRVCVRTRPLSSGEVDHTKVVFCQGPLCRVVPPGKSGRAFSFSRCFDEDSEQQEVFETCGVKGQVERSLDGFSSLVFAFGQTGAGKTYTMFSALGEENINVESQQAGLIPRAMNYLFYLIHSRQSQSPIKYSVRASFIEIYNEQVRDLLRPGAPLKIHWKENNGFYAENHVVVECSGVDDAMAIVNEGVRNRRVGSHNLNSESSRSHSIFLIDVDSFRTDNNGDRYLQSGRLLFVDLAGSEKLKQTGSSGEVLHEAKSINKSLLTLGKVISTLSRLHKGKKKGEKGEKNDKGTMRGKGGIGESGRQYLKEHVPFRDSALTKLLMHSFLGNSYVLMICCCAPTGRCAEETLATLRYASRAMDIEVNPASRVSLMGSGNPEKQMQQIEMLKEEIKKLTVENKRLQQIASQPSSGNSTPSLSPIQSFNNKSHRLTPPPYSANTFLPSLYNSSSSPTGSFPTSPSPSFPSSPHQLGTQSPPRNSPYLSPIGSPNRNSNSPLMQMYHHNQQQMQLQMHEEAGIEDYKRQVARLEMLLSEMAVQNSHLKAENSQLFSVCEQTKSEYTRLVHKLDTMEAIFFKQGELPLPWSSSRILPEPLKSEGFLKKVKSLNSAAHKPLDSRKSSEINLLQSSELKRE